MSVHSEHNICHTMWYSALVIRHGDESDTAGVATSCRRRDVTMSQYVHEHKRPFSKRQLV
eukprot:1825544-Pyramimonas_sp.AAC.1